MTIRTLTAASLLSLATAIATPALAQQAPIVQPGAPDAESRTLKAEDATKLADTAFSPADVMFMQMMIPHHAQALELTELVEGRTSNPDMLKIAGRIAASQEDEMKFMREWLSSRGQSEDMPHMPGMSHAEHMAAMGMATPAQMKRLATLKGNEFDALFLELMTRHHKGAVDMVDELLQQPGTAYDPVMFEFVNDVKNEQQGEIDRMNVVAARISDDPRAGLAAGFRDAGEAISNMRLVTAMPKPTGFFDPANPAQLQPRIVDEKEEGEEAELVAATKPDPRDEDDEESKDRFGQRGSLLSFANTDMAFSGDMLVTGNYHGFNAYRLGADGVPSLVSSVVCPGGQGDVSIVGDILHSRVARSNIYGLLKLGAEVAVCGPPTLMPPAIQELGVTAFTRIEEAIEWAGVLNVLRLQLERMHGGFVPSLREYNRIWGVSSQRLDAAPRDVLVLHPGPMNRGVEIDSDVADGPHSVILNQVTNGVAIRMAVLYLLAGGRQESAEAAKQGGEA